MSYGQELILDLADCDPNTFTRDVIKQFLIDLCDLIEMERHDLHFWDFQDASPAEVEEARKNPHTFGISAVQFIMTSSIVIHTLPLLGQCLINVFSCKEFDIEVVTSLALSRFKADTMNRTELERG